MLRLLGFKGLQVLAWSYPQDLQRFLRYDIRLVHEHQQPHMALDGRHIAVIKDGRLYLGTGHGHFTCHHTDAIAVIAGPYPFNFFVITGASKLYIISMTNLTTLLIPFGIRTCIGFEFTKFSWTLVLPNGEAAQLVDTPIWACDPRTVKRSESGSVLEVGSNRLEQTADGRFLYNGEELQLCPEGVGSQTL